jgi:hypothetical protein
MPRSSISISVLGPTKQQYWDEQMNYGRIVIHAGDWIRYSHDGAHHAQAQEWVSPNFFAPYQTEYELGLEFGSLWVTGSKTCGKRLRSWEEMTNDRSIWGLELSPRKFSALPVGSRRTAP